MPKELDQSCTKYTGHLLTVEVHYGWGWQGRMSKASSKVYEPMEEPSNFHLRVNYFFPWQNVLRGGVGRIEEEGHIYDNFWIVFYTRPLGKYDFTDNITTYSMQIGPDEPWMLPPPENPELDEPWPCWEFSGVPKLLGFGVVTTDAEGIAIWEKAHILKPEQAHHFKTLAEYQKQK